MSTWRVIEWTSRGEKLTIPKVFQFAIGKNKMVMIVPPNANELPMIGDRSRVMTYSLCGDLEDSVPSSNNITMTFTSFEKGMFTEKKPKYCAV
jgi:hypothetical protein